VSIYRNNILIKAFNRLHSRSHTPHPNPLPRHWGEGRVRGTYVTILMLRVMILLEIAYPEEH